MVDQRHREEPGQTEDRHEHQPHRRLSNRIAYLGIISFVSPLINFVLNWEEAKSMGWTMSLMLWLLFGGLWCGGFATVMGPIFAAISVILRLLDVVPALGTSLWVCLSTLVTVGVMHDPFPAFMHNLPLFSLIFANGLVFMSEISQDQGFWHLARVSTPRAIQGNIRRSSDLTGFREPCYYWMAGRCCFGSLQPTSPTPPLFVLDSLSIPDEASESLRQLLEKGYDYMCGRELDDFEEKFHTWEQHAKRIASVFNFRRLFCFIGFATEAAAVVCTIALLGTLSSSGLTSKSANVAEAESNPMPSPEAANTAAILTVHRAVIMSPSDFSVPQVVICVVLVFFSDYLQTMINVSNSFSSQIEVRAMMVRCLSSKFFNFSGPRSGYLRNRSRVQGPQMLEEDAAIPVKELPGLGIIPDLSESEESNLTILKSKIPSIHLAVNRAGESLVATSLYDPASDREELLPSGSGKVDIRDQDLVI